MKKILGQKIGMISSFQKNGKLIPVTIISAEPNVVIEVKEQSKNGYNATKVGYLKVQEKALNKAENGVFKKAKTEPRKHIKEFRDVTGYSVGDSISVAEFKIGDHVDAQATSKGHGFTGAIKRWNFKCGPKSHGAGFPHRYQGSISFGRGGSQGQRVMKGKKMSGHWGVETVTISNLEIVDIDLEKNLILVKGSVPGPKGALVVISSTKKVKKFEPTVELVNYEKQSAKPVEETPVVEEAAPAPTPAFEEAAQVVEETPAPVEETKVEEPAPAVEEVKTEEPAPVAEEAAPAQAEEPAPVVEETPAVEEKPTEESNE